MILKPPYFMGCSKNSLPVYQGRKMADKTPDPPAHMG